MLVRNVMTPRAETIGPDEGDRLVGMLSVDDVALRSPRLAGEVVEHVREPGRSIRAGEWSWWEAAAP